MQDHSCLDSAPTVTRAGIVDFMAAPHVGPEVCVSETPARQGEIVTFLTTSVQLPYARSLDSYLQCGNGTMTQLPDVGEKHSCTPGYALRVVFDFSDWVPNEVGWVKGDIMKDSSSVPASFGKQALTQAAGVGIAGVTALVTTAISLLVKKGVQQCKGRRAAPLADRIPNPMRAIAGMGWEPGA